MTLLNFKKTLVSTLFTVAALATAPAFAADAPAANATQKKLEAIYKSSNIKAGLINFCKENNTQNKEFSSAEISKLCSCEVETEGRMTNAQKWEIQSAINAKDKNRYTAAVKQQQASVEACYGPKLTSKIQKLHQEAMKSAQIKK